MRSKYLLTILLWAGVCFFAPNCVWAEGGYDFASPVLGGISPENDKFFNNPQGVAVDPVNGYIYVADSQNHRIQKFSSTGAPTLKWGGYGTQTGQFKSPEGIAVGTNGCVYVADTGNHRIQKFSGTGTYLLSWGSYGSGNGQFWSPTGIAVDTAGYVYVADRGNGRIQKFSSTGGWVANWTTGLVSPQGIAIGTSGDIFVSDPDSGNIRRFPVEGGTNLFLTGITSEGIAVDPEGYVYVTDTGGNVIKKFTGTGTLIWGTSTGFSSPKGIAVGSGYAYVADSNNNRLVKLATETGTTLDQWGSLGSSTGCLNFPQAMAIDASGNIYIADTNNHCIQKYDRVQGTFTLKWGSLGSSPGLFNSPQGIAVDTTNNRLYVSDSGNNRIQKFDLSGNFITSWTNSLNSPQGIAVDSSGNVCVVNMGGNKIERFNSDGVPLDSGWPFGQYGAGNGYFNSPQGIAIATSGDVYIADTGNHRIQKFSNSGSFTAKWGEDGTTTGKFKSPQAIAIDIYGYVYVVDTNNHRIQKFTSVGSFITSWGSEGTDTGRFEFPQGIAAGTDNTIYILDTNNHRIQKFISTPLTVTNITPTQAPNNAATQTTITGTGFLSQATVRLVRPGYSDIIGTGTAAESSTITCIFNLAGVQFGTWAVVVYNPNGHLAIATLTTIAFTVNDPDSPTIATATTRDSDNDGFIDAVDVIFSEEIKDSRVEVSNFRVGTISVGSWATLSTVNDRYIRLFFTDGILTSSATPTLIYTPNAAGTLTDLSDNPMYAATITTLDCAPPVLILILPSAGGFDNQEIFINYWLSENVETSTLRIKFADGITCFIPSGSLSAGAGTQTATVRGSDFGLTDGTYTVTLIATDLAGNPATSTPNTNWTYDTGTPTLWLIKPATGGYDNQEITVEYRLCEDIATSTLRLTFIDAGNNASWTSPGSLTLATKGATHTITINGRHLGLREGATYTVILSGDDLAGNPGSSTPATGWTYKTTPPQATLTTPSANSSGSETITISYELSEDISPGSLKLKFTRTGGENDGASPRYADSILLTTKGTHTVVIKGNDLDSDGTATDSLVNGAIYSVCLAMNDLAGNPGSSNTNSNWTYDVTPPTITLIKPVANGFDNESIAVEYKLTEVADLSSVKLIFTGTSTAQTVTAKLTGGMNNSLTIYGNDLNNDGTSTPDRLTDGTYTVKLLASDQAGNPGNPAVYFNWTYDTLSPTPTISLKENATYTNTRLVSVAVGGDQIEDKYIIGENRSTQPAEGSDWSDSEPTSFTLSDGDGIKTVYIWLKDKAGNINLNPVSDTIILSTYAPEITLIKPETSGFDNDSVTVEYKITSGTVDPSTCKLIFTGSHSYTATSTDISFTNTAGTISLEFNALGKLIDGTYTVVLVGTDYAGNTGTSNATANWTYDTGTPSITLTRPDTNSVDNHLLTVRYTLAENMATATLILAFVGTDSTVHTFNSSSFMGRNGSCTISGVDISSLNLKDGATYTVCLRGSDLAGNPGTSNLVTNFRYDDSIGIPSLLLANGAVYTSQTTVNVTIGTPTESGTISFLLSETQISSPDEGSGSWTTTRPATFTLGTANGLKTVYLWIKDEAGNMSSVSDTITLDTVSPAVRLINPADNGFGTRTIIVSYSLEEESATSSIRLMFSGTASVLPATSTDFSGQQGTHSLLIALDNIGLSDGATYTVILVADDLAGNHGTSSPSIKNWMYDVAIPQPSLFLRDTDSSQTSTAYSNSQNVYVAITNDSEAVNYYISETQQGTPTLSSTHWNSKPSGFSLSAGDSKKTVYLWVRDRANNINGTSATITLDTTLPTLSLIKPAADGFDNETVSVEYNLSEDIGTDTLILTFTRTGGAEDSSVHRATLSTTAKGKGTATLTGLSLMNGTIYSVKLDGVDIAGNAASVSNNNWTYDNISPTINLLKPESNGCDNRLIEVIYTLSEIADSNSLKLVFAGTSGGPRTVTTRLTAYEGRNSLSIEGDDLNNNGGTLSTNSLADGATYTVTLTASDKAGNFSSSTITPWLYDNTFSGSISLTLSDQDTGSPGITDTSVIDVTIATSTQTEFISAWMLSEVQTTIPAEDSSAWQTTRPTAYLLSIGNGTKTVYLWVKDAAGNANTFTVTAKIKLDTNLDTTKPTVTLSKPVNNGMDNQSIAVEYYLSEACNSGRLVFQRGITIVEATSGLTWNPFNNSAVITVPGLTDGTYTVYLEATDMGGNPGSSSIAYNWVYDTTPPGATLTITGSYTNTTNISVGVTNDSDVASWLISETQIHQPAENSSSWNSKPTNFTLSQGDGTKTVYLWVKDTAGNINQATATAAVILDMTAPTIILNAPSESGVGNGSITVSYTLSEGIAAGSLILGFSRTGGTVDPDSPRFYTITTTADRLAGPHQFTLAGSSLNLKDGGIYAVSLAGKDLAGNAGQDTNSNWRYDTSIKIPTLSLNNGALSTNSTVVSVTTGSDEEATAWFIATSSTPPSVEDTGWDSKPTTFTLPPGDGTKTVYLWVKDLAGNINTTPGSDTIILDTTAITVSLNTPAANGTDNQTIGVEYHLSEAASNIKLTFTSYSDPNSPHQVTALLTANKGTKSLVLDGADLNNDGNQTVKDHLVDQATYTVTLEAKDVAGNSSSTSTTNWVYDTSIANPILTLANLTNSRVISGTITNDSETVGWLLSETQSTKPSSQTHGSWTSARPATFTLSSPDGLKTVYLWVKDGVGNINEGPVSGTVTLDTTPPTLTLSTPATNGTGTQPIEISYNLSEPVEPGSLKFIFFRQGESHTITTTNSGLTANQGNNSLAISGLTLTDQATYTVSLQAADLAGNPGTAGISTNWKYDISVGTPSLTLREQNGSSTTLTRWTVVNVKIGNEDGDVEGWLISETQGTQPSSNDANWQNTRPTAFSLSSGNGQKTVYLWVKDKPGNISSGCGQHTIKLDTSLAGDVQKPVIILNAPPANGFDNQTILVSYQLSELADPASLQLVFVGSSGTFTATNANGLTPFSGNNSLVLSGSQTGLIPGTYTVTLLARDLADNSGSSTPILNWTYDNSIPEPTLILKDRPSHQKATYTTSRFVEVKIEMAQDDSGINGWILSEYQADTPEESDNWRPGQPALLSLTEGDGTKTVYLWIKDRAGNMASATAITVLDTANPVLKLINPVSNGFGSATFLIKYTLSEDVEPDSLKLTFDSAQDSNSPHEITGLPATATLPGQPQVYGISGKAVGLKDGAVYTILLEAADAASNQAEIVYAANWTYDAAPPVLTLQKPGAGGVDNSTIEIKYSLSEAVNPTSLKLIFSRPGESYTVSIGLNSQAGNNSVTISNLRLTDQATYTVTLQADDLAGNPGTPGISTNWRYDSSIGTPTLIARPTRTNSRLITVEITNDPDVVGWLLSEIYGSPPAEDNSDWQAVKPTSYTLNKGEGTKTVYLWVKDLAGNVNLNQVSKQVVSDTTAPVLSLNQPAIKGNQAVEVSYTLSEEIAPGTLKLTFTGKGDADSPHLVTNLDGSTGQHGTTLTTLKLVSEATYTVSLEGTDLAGNPGSQVVITDWRYDITGPSIKLILPAGGGRDNQSLRISYVLSEACKASSLQLIFANGGGQQVLSTGLTGNEGTNTLIEDVSGLPGLIDGATYTVILAGTDLAGNRGTSNPAANWTYDISIATPTLSLAEWLTGKTGTGSTIVVATNIICATETVGWLLSETQSTQPAESNPNWQLNQPETFLLTSTNGQKTVYLWVKDSLGNISTAAAVARIILDTTLDKTPPTISLITPASNGYDNQSIEVKYHLSEPLDPNSLRLIFRSTSSEQVATGGLSWQFGTNSVILDGAALGLGDGQKYEVVLAGKDAAGYSGTSNISTDWMYDITPPTLVLYNPAPNDIDNQAIAVSYYLSEEVDPNSLKLTFTSDNDPNSPHLVSALLTAGRGVHTLIINGNDLLRDGYFTTTDHLINGRAYDVRLEAGDLAGNAGTAVTNSNWTYAISSLSVKLNKPAANGVDDRSIEINYELSETADLQTIRFIFILQAMPDFPRTFTSSGLTANRGVNTFSFDGSSIGLVEGTYNVTLRASLVEGLPEVPVTNSNWVYDLRIATPTLVLADGATYTNKTNIKVEVSNDSEAKAWLISETQNTRPTPDNPAWGEGEKPTGFTLSTGDGLKTVYLWVKDAAGNVNSQPVSDTIILDTTAPALSLISPSTNGADNGSITVTYYLSEDLSTNSLKLIFNWTGGNYDGSSTHINIMERGLPPARGYNSIVINGTELKLVDGAIYTVTLPGSDLAGNAGLEAISTNWTYDISIAAPTLGVKDQTTNSSLYTSSDLIKILIGNDSEAVSWIVSEDETPGKEQDVRWSTEPTSYSLSEGDGTKTLYLWVRDRAGNISSERVFASIILDTQEPAPPGTPTEGSPDKDFTSEGTYTIFWSLSTAASRIESYELQEKAGEGDWKTLSQTMAGELNSFGVRERLEGERYQYRVRAKSRVGRWSGWSAISDGIVVARLIDDMVGATITSVEGKRSVKVPKGALGTATGYILINPDPLNNPTRVDPADIRAANGKDEVDPSYDRLQDTLTEINGYFACRQRIEQFGKLITITLFYQDANQDGIVDNTAHPIQETHLRMFKLDELTKSWVEVPGSVVNPASNTVSARVQSLSAFILRGPAQVPAGVLGKVIAYPNPYKPNRNPEHTVITFGHPTDTNRKLTSHATIRIFTIHAELVKTIKEPEDDGKADGQASWDTMNEAGQDVASGIYIYQVTDDWGGQTIGRLAIIR